MNNQQTLVAMVMWALIFAPLCAFVAAKKGRNVAGWAVAGALLGVLALLSLLFEKASAPMASGTRKSFWRGKQVPPA